MLTLSHFSLDACVWNPVDDWQCAKTARFEVLEEVGPIAIDDGNLVTAAVRTNEEGDLLYMVHC